MNRSLLIYGAVGFVREILQVTQDYPAEICTGTILLERVAYAVGASLCRPNALARPSSPGVAGSIRARATTDHRGRRVGFQPKVSDAGASAILGGQTCPGPIRCRGLRWVTGGLGVNVSENVAIRQSAKFGAGTVLIPHAHVGAWSIVGADSVIARPLERNVTAVGLRPGLCNPE